MSFQPAVEAERETLLFRLLIEGHSTSEEEESLQFHIWYNEGSSPQLMLGEDF